MNVAVFFGGKSVEHEVSVISGIQLCKTLLLEHEVTPVYITKNNEFYVDRDLLNEGFYLENHYHKNGFMRIENKEKPMLISKRNPLKKIRFDIAFLCVHGQGVEDGKIASLFELLDIPYVGPNVLSSSLAQNKYQTKKLLKSSNVDVIDFDVLCDSNLSNRDLRKVESIGFPMIVKANNLGSSIGVEVVNSLEELKSSLDYIFKYDQEIIIEKYIKNRKEYNISLLLDKQNVQLSMIEEVKGEVILSYENKYLENKQGMAGCDRICPASLKNNLKKKIEYTAKKIYYALGFNSLVRFDFIYDEDENKLYFNEANSIPGSYAYYLYKDKYTFLELLNKLIDNGFYQHVCKTELIRTINNNRIYLRNNGLKFK